MVCVRVVNVFQLLWHFNDPPPQKHEYILYGSNICACVLWANIWQIAVHVPGARVLRTVRLRPCIHFTYSSQTMSNFRKDDSRSGQVLILQRNECLSPRLLADMWTTCISLLIARSQEHGLSDLFRSQNAENQATDSLVFWPSKSVYRSFHFSACYFLVFLLVKCTFCPVDSR